MYNKRFFGFLMGLSFILCSRSFAQEAPPDNATAAAGPLRIVENRVSLPLRSVLFLALKNNLDITFARLQPQVAATDVTREKSAYDFLFTSQFTKRRDKRQVGSVLGGSSSPVISQEWFDFEAKLQKRFALGTLADLKLTHQEYQTNLVFQGLNPQYTGELTLNLTQPLLRDFGIDTGTSLIRIASLNLQISHNEFRENVMDILYQVESFYWNLYYRIEDLKSKEKALRSAEDLLREFKIRIDAGTLAPIEIYQAKAEVALRKQDVIVARASVKETEDLLKAALNLYEDEKYWNVTVVPTDVPRTEPLQPDLQESVRTALQKRPDFQQAKLGVQAANIQVKYSRNQTLPRVDLIGSLGTNALAGRPSDTTGAFGRFYRGTPSPWDGHWDDVYDGLGESDYYSYLVGVKVEFPLQNRLAKSQYARARVQASQSLTNLKNSENIIINEVRDAVRRIETSQKVVETAEASLKYTQEKLKAEEKKYKVGMSTTHDLLEFQEDLAAAESTLAFAASEHSKSVANLARVMGVLLEAKDLTL